MEEVAKGSSGRSEYGCAMVEEIIQTYFFLPLDEEQE